MTAVLLACCAAIAASCGQGGTDVTVTWNIAPTPPVAGAETVVRMTLRQGDGKAADGATLRLEAHMAHPGMAPVTSEVVERQRGAYEGRLRLSMAGDWMFVVTGHLRDGSRITEEVSVPAVRAATGPAARP